MIVLSALHVQFWRFHIEVLENGINSRNEFTEFVYGIEPDCYGSCEQFWLLSLVEFKGQVKINHRDA